MLKEYVDTGAKRLDKEYPGWHRMINVDTINMSHHADCILGQLYGEYVIGTDKLGIHLHWESVQHGYTKDCREWNSTVTWVEVKDAWVEAIEERVVGEYVDAGAKALDEEYPSWHEKIDLEKLDMSGGDNCILGQLYGKYLHGSTVLRLGGLRGSVQHGFTIRRNVPPDNIKAWADLKGAWITAIEGRLEYVLREALMDTVEANNDAEKLSMTWYLVFDGPWQVALMTTSSVEAAGFYAGLKHLGVESSIIEKEVYNS